MKTNVIASYFSSMTVTKWGVLSIAPLLAILLSLKGMLLAYFIFLTIDFATGFNKSLHIAGIKKNPFKKQFWLKLTSKGMRQTWTKNTQYLIGISMFIVLDLLVLNQAIIATVLKRPCTISELAIGVACGIEIYSSFENMEAVSGENLLKKMMWFFPKKFLSLVKK